MSNRLRPPLVTTSSMSYILPLLKPGPNFFTAGVRYLLDVLSWSRLVPPLGTRSDLPAIFK